MLLLTCRYKGAQKLYCALDTKYRCRALPNVVSRYTGFCPDITEHIGYNYQKATREIMKEHPHVQTRLSPVHYPDRHHPKGKCQYFCPVPEYIQACNEGHYGSIPGPMEASMWRACQGDYTPEPRYPEQAYPLTCSEWVSPCVSNHCNETYAPCIRRQSYACHDHVMMPPEMSYPQNFQQRHKQSSEACCDSCASGGRCSGGNKNESDVYKYPRKKFRSSQIMDHRKGGVVPNYMGHIPGMQNSFGEPYAIAASRLLRRHFDELSRKG